MFWQHWKPGMNSMSMLKYFFKLVFAITMFAMLYDILFEDYNVEDDYTGVINTWNGNPEVRGQNLDNYRKILKARAELIKENKIRDNKGSVEEVHVDAYNKDLNNLGSVGNIDTHLKDLNPLKGSGDVESVANMDSRFKDLNPLKGSDDEGPVANMDSHLNGFDALNGNVDDEFAESERMLEELEKYESLLKMELEDDTKSTENEATNLIINTYMRSGSTFLGKIFSLRSDTFYVYEPLWNVQKFAYYHGPRTVCHYTEHRCSKPGKEAENSEIGSAVKIHESLDFLNGLLNCSFKQFRTFLPDSRRFKESFPNIKDSWNFAKGDSWETYNECSQRPEATYDECMREMQPVCLSKKHKVLKVLRSTLDNFEYLIKPNRNLKVIHLFRDPRGVINSHLHTPFIKRKVDTRQTMENDIHTLCDRMRVDIQTSLHLRRVYKNQVLVVQYEDFGNVVHNANILYNFMNMDTSPELLEALEELNNQNSDTVGFHPFSYTKTLSWDVEKLVQKHCKGILQALGYPVFSSLHAMRTFKMSDLPTLPYALSNQQL